MINTRNNKRFISIILIVLLLFLPFSVVLDVAIDIIY